MNDYNYDNHSPIYYYCSPVVNTSLEEQLSLINQQPKDLSMEQLLSTPIPTLYIQQQPTHYYQPSSPSSSHSSSPPSDSSPILHDRFLDELLMPEMEYQLLPTPAASVSPSCASNTNKVIKNKKTLSHKKSYPPGQCTLPIRVATRKPIRPPRHLECFNCKITKTPLWRRTPDRLQTLCNACGLYYKQYNQHRPLHISHKPSGVNTTTTTPALLRPPSYQHEKWIPPIKFEQPSPSPSPSPSPPPPSQQQQISEQVVHDDIECINCQQTNTPLWRKNENGDPLCNACGLYAKLHHRNRPVEMRKSTIQRRRRDWTLQQQSPLTADNANSNMAPFLSAFPSNQMVELNESCLGLFEYPA